MHSLAILLTAANALAAQDFKLPPLAHNLTIPSRPQNRYLPPLAHALAPNPPPSQLSDQNTAPSGPPSNSEFCLSHNPALASTINELCLWSHDASGLIIGNNWTHVHSDPEYSFPTPAEIDIQGACASETTGPPENVSGICFPLMWALCRERVEYGRAVVLNRGKEDCQAWFIVGWNETTNPVSHVSWDRPKIFREEDLRVQWEDDQAVGLEGVPKGEAELKSMKGLDGMVLGAFAGAVVGLMVLGEIVRRCLSTEWMQERVMRFVRPRRVTGFQV